MKWWLIFGLTTSLWLNGEGALLASQTMSFVPGEKAPIFATSYRARGSHFHRRSFQARGRAPSRNQADEEPSAAAPPGSGFKMEDGVLTYPAPARFQPKNLKHL